MQKLNSKAFYLKNFLYKKRTITEPDNQRRSEMASPCRPIFQRISGLNRRKDGKEVEQSTSSYNLRNRKYSYDSDALKRSGAKEGSSSDFLKASSTKNSHEQMSKLQSIFHKNSTIQRYFQQFPTISIELSLIKPKKSIKDIINPNAHSRLPTRNDKRIPTARTSQLKKKQLPNAYQSNNNKMVYQVHNACISSTPNKRATHNRSIS